MADRFQMRLVVNKVADPAAPVLLDAPVCIDVVFRGAQVDIDKVMPILRSFLDAGSFYGDWAGIGRGMYLDADRVITLG